MLFRTHIAVIKAIQEDHPHIPDEEVNWHETVTYTFGINANDAANAAAIAVRAAENAVDRDGRFVGGVVIEVQPKCVGPEEFEGSENYFIQPLEERGIFYVSGTISSAISFHEASSAMESLQSIRASIEQNGLPAPSFVYPQLDDIYETKAVRIVCPMCNHWVEVDGTGLIYSFFDGMDPASDEFEEGQEAVRVAGPFVKSHFACLNGSDDFNALLFIYEDDERYEFLDESNRV